MKLTYSEEKVKGLLEKLGYRVLKGSYPDFIVYRSDKDFCFLEVKAKKTEKLSVSQRFTAQILRELGINFHLLHADSIIADAFNSESYSNINRAIADLEPNRLDRIQKSNFLIQGNGDDELFDFCGYVGWVLEQWNCQNAGITWENLSNEDAEKVVSSLNEYLEEEYQNCPSEHPRQIRSHLLSHYKEYLADWENTFLPKLIRKLMKSGQLHEEKPDDIETDL